MDLAQNAGTAVVNRIPPEILVGIFQDLAYDARPRASWIRITHVSRRWRDIALTCRSLWSYVSSEYPPALISTCLRRSDSALLQVEYLSPQAWTAEKRDRATVFTNALSRCSSRVEVLKCSPTAVEANIFAGTFLAGLHSLRSLILSCMKEHSHLVRLGDLEAFNLPEQVVSNLTGLHTLSLSSFTMPRWDLPLFRGLETLVLVDQVQRFTPSMDTFLEVLEKCPSLRRLELNYAGPTLGTNKVSSLSPTPPQVIQLPHSLQTMFLTPRYFYDAQSLLSRIRLPETAFLFISFMRVPVPFFVAQGTLNDGTLDMFLPRDKYNLRILSPISTLFFVLYSQRANLMIEVDGTSGVEPTKVSRYPLGGLTRNDTGGVMREDGDGEPRIHFTLPKHKRSFPDPSFDIAAWCLENFRGLGSVFASSAIRQLDLNFLSDLLNPTVEDWERLLSSFLNLTSLCVATNSRVTGVGVKDTEPEEMHSHALVGLFTASQRRTSEGDLLAPHLSFLCCFDKEEVVANDRVKASIHMFLSARRRMIHRLV